MYENVRKGVPKYETVRKSQKGQFLAVFPLLLRIIACYQPSSAGIERVFSILGMMSEQQERALQDYQILVCMARYNNRHDKVEK